jgi:hypothetical protein
MMETFQIIIFDENYSRFFNPNSIKYSSMNTDLQNGSLLSNAGIFIQGCVRKCACGFLP